MYLLHKREREGGGGREREHHLSAEVCFVKQYLLNTSLPAPVFVSDKPPPPFIIYLKGTSYVLLKL